MNSLYYEFTFTFFFQLVSGLHERIIVIKNFLNKETIIEMLSQPQ